MFETAYVVDVVSSNGQHFDSGIIGDATTATEVYENVCNDEIEIRPLPENFTVRLIKNGEVIRHSDINSHRRG